MHPHARLLSEHADQIIGERRKALAPALIRLDTQQAGEKPLGKNVELGFQPLSVIARYVCPFTPQADLAHQHIEGFLVKDSGGVRVGN